MKITARLAVPAAVMALAAAPGAHAATPEKGSVSGSSSKAAWSGTLSNAWVQWNAWYVDPERPCAHATQCDKFDLKVTTAGDLVFTAGSDAVYDDGSKPSVGIRVQKPDGEIVYGHGEGSQEAPFMLAVDGAPAGDYIVHVTEATAAVGTDPSVNYTASATLDTGAPAASPDSQKKPEQKPQAEQKPQPQTQPPSQPQQTNGPSAPPSPEQRSSSSASAFTMTAKAPALSARKASKAKGFAVKVTTSRAIQRLTVVLKKGKKTVASSKAAPFKGKGSVRLKATKKLKAGSYTLSIVGSDGGVTVARNLKLKIRR